MDPNHQGMPPMPKDGRLPTPEEVEKIVERHPELHKPLMFANHQKKFVAFTWATCFAMTVYYVFWHEFPVEEHCFSPIRRVVGGWKDKFFAVNDQENEAVQQRIQELKDKLDAKKSKENLQASS